MRGFQFSDDEYNKLSSITGLTAIDLQKLDALGLLTNDVAIRMVLEYEYNHQRKTTKALPTLIIQAIANKYGLTPQKMRGFYFIASDLYIIVPSVARKFLKVIARNTMVCVKNVQ